MIAASPHQDRNRFAIAALVFGVLWLYWIGSILALIFGYLALRQIGRSPDTQSGRGMAIAGIVVGSSELALLVLLIIVLALASSAPGPCFC